MKNRENILVAFIVVMSLIVILISCNILFRDNQDSEMDTIDSNADDDWDEITYDFSSDTLFETHEDIWLDTYEDITYRVPDFDELDRLPHVGSLHEVFFTDTNRKGTIPDGAYDYSSGWPTLDPSRIPQDDRSALIGESFAIRLTTENLYVAEAVDGSYENSYYSLYEPTYVFWHYRNERGEERLAVYVDSSNIPLFLIYATDLGSTEALRLAMEQAIYFPATLVAAANVDYRNSESLFLSGALSGHPLVTEPLGDPYRTTVATAVGYGQQHDITHLFLDEQGDKAFWFVERMKQQYGLRD